jgi:hypothetical protein
MDNSVGSTNRMKGITRTVIANTMALMRMRIRAIFQ